MPWPELNWFRTHQIGREDSPVVGRVSVQDVPPDRLWGNGAAHGLLDLRRSVVDHLAHLDFFLAPQVAGRHKAMLKGLEETQAVANHCARRSVIRLCLPDVRLLKMLLSIVDCKTSLTNGWRIWQRSEIGSAVFWHARELSFLRWSSYVLLGSCTA